MSESSGHHHHHHHKMDSASKFKRESLLAIERRKQIAKWGKRILVVIAIIMGLVVAAAYTIG
ncbi:MAG: hypothetical protein IJ081_04210 [Prevotella sp.]|jgi:hypothetical protein|nr:hypothetical protein [Prevotella sp.]